MNLSLPNGKICAISSAALAAKIEGVFESFQEAAKFFKVLDYRRIRRYFGTKKLVKTLKGNFYFTAVKGRRDKELMIYYSTKKSIPNKSIIAYDLSETSSLLPTKVYSFISINQAEKELKIHHNFIKKHFDKGTIYIGKDGRKFRFLPG